MGNIVNLISTIDLPDLPKDFKSILKASANKANINRIAIVGGFIRDELIRIIHKEQIKHFTDIDIVLEGSAIEFAKILKNIIPNEEIIILNNNIEFNTVDLKINGIKIDLAGSRLEKYQSPGENPQIYQSNIEEDLKRRDININAMAFELIENKLIDIFKGQRSIEFKKISLIHPKSISDDPTRIIRCARYVSRLGFNLSDDSINQIKSTINIWPWHWEHGNPIYLAPTSLSTRLRMELEILLYKENWVKSIGKLQEWGALILLDQSIQKDKDWERRVKWGMRLGVNRLTALISISKDSFSIAERLQIPHSQKKVLIELIEIKKLVNSIAIANDYSDWAPSIWCNKFESANFNPESVAIAICLKLTFWKQLYRWWKKWRLIKSNISAKELMDQGWIEGPKLGKELKRLRNIQIDRGNCF